MGKNKLDFLIGDYQKSGTSFLDSLLRKHHEIWMPKRNPQHNYFSYRKAYDQGSKWFDDLLETNQEYKIIGHTQAGCASNLDAIGRIVNHNPKIKLILVLRQPVDRAYSHYWHEAKVGRESKPFEKALAYEATRIKKSEWHYGTYSYVGKSKYNIHINNLSNAIPKEQMLLVKFENLKDSPLNTINRIFKFLNVSEIDSLEEIGFSKAKKNKGKIPRYIWLQRLAYFLRFIKLGRLMKFIHDLNLTQKLPPKLKDETRRYLEKELAEAIDIHSKL